jgi:hypothetical protein
MFLVHFLQNFMCYVIPLIKEFFKLVDISFKFIFELFYICKQHLDFNNHLLINWDWNFLSTFCWELK